MATVKLFDLNRLARFENQYSGEPVYFVPGDLMGLIEYKSGDVKLSRVRADFDRVKVFLTGDVSFDLCATIEEVEAEINRALQATKDDMDAFTQRTAEDIKEQIRGIKAEFESKKNEEAFSSNDFYCDPTKDKN